MATDPKNVFELDTNDVLGSGFRGYIADLRALSLTDPKRYFLLRTELSKKIVDDIVNQMYKTVFKALTKGQSHDDKALSSTVNYGGGAGAFCPKFPSQKANIISMKIAEDLETELLEVLAILMPVSFDNIMSSALNLVSKASTVTV